MTEPLVTVEWLAQHFDDPDLVILDASPKSNKSNLSAEYPNLQIKGARFFDFKHSFSDKESTLPNMIPSPEAFASGCRQLGINQRSKIVVYDNLGVYSSPRVWWMFKVMGHEAIAVLDGGLTAWHDGGYACEIKRPDGPIPPGDFTAHYQPELVKNAASIFNNLTNKETLVIDARSTGRFHGQTPEPRAGLRGGHIPGSISLPFGRVLKQRKFLPKEDLRKVFQELPLGDRPLVFTCGSGITACIILLASELTSDNPKSLYDGSWSEWGQLESYPVEQ